MNNLIQNKIIKILALLSCMVCAMLLYRLKLSGRLSFFFLGWNLALAWMPLILSTVILRLYRNGKSLFLIIPVGIIWLLFQPNAPYLITDLFHLKVRPGIPLWYDLMLLNIAAWTGLMLGLLSLYQIHHWLRMVLPSVLTWVIIGIISFATGFGVYLGRFERWNSWDLLSRPGSLLQASILQLDNPHLHNPAFGLTILIGFFLLGAYLVVWYLGTTGASLSASPTSNRPTL